MSKMNCKRNCLGAYGLFSLSSMGLLTTVPFWKDATYARGMPLVILQNISKISCYHFQWPWLILEPAGSDTTDCYADSVLVQVFVFFILWVPVAGSPPCARQRWEIYVYIYICMYFCICSFISMLVSIVMIYVYIDIRKDSSYCTLHGGLKVLQY